MDFESLYQSYLSVGFSEEQARSIARERLGQLEPPEPTVTEEPKAGFVGGLGRGVAETAASYAGGLGWLGERVGVDTELRERAERFAEEGPELTKAGEVGRIVGRLGSELAGAFTGGGLALRGASKIPAVGRALAGASRAQRAAATAAANLPIDVAQAAAYREGIALPGFGGALAENVALSGTAGALLGPVRLTGRAARLADQEEAAREIARVVESGKLPRPQGFEEVRSVPGVVEPTAREAIRFGRQGQAPSPSEIATRRLERAAEMAPQPAPKELPFGTAMPEGIEVVQPYAARSAQKQAGSMARVRRSEANVEQMRRASESERIVADRLAEIEAQRRAGELGDIPAPLIQGVSPRGELGISDIFRRRAETKRAAESVSRARRAERAVAPEEIVADVIEQAPLPPAAPAPRRAQAPARESLLEIPSVMRPRAPGVQEDLLRTAEESRRRVEAPKARELAREESSQIAQEIARVGEETMERMGRSIRRLSEAEETGAIARDVEDRLARASQIGAEEAAARARGDRGIALFSGFPAASLDVLRLQSAQTAVSAGLGAAVGGATAEEGEELGGAVLGGVIGSIVPSLARKALRSGGKVSTEDIRTAANEEAGRAYRRSAPRLGPKEGPIPTIQKEVGPEASADYLARFGERETLSTAEARRIASTRNAEDAVGRFYAGQKLDSPDIELLGSEIKRTSDQWKYFSSQADEIEKLGDTRLANTLRDSAAEAYEKLMRLSYASSNELSESARKMRFQRDVFRQLGITTPSQYRTLVKNAIGIKELKPSLRAEMEQILSIADQGLRETKLAEFAQRNARTSFPDLVMDIRKAGLLSRPASWIRNFVGSAEGLIGEIVETPMASAIDRIVSAGAGRERVFGDLGLVDRIATSAKGWGEGAKKVWNNRRAYLEGINPEEPLNTLGRRLINYENAVGADAPAYLRGAAGVLQKANNFIYGVIAGGDQPFYQAALNTSLKDRGLVRALNSAEVKSGAIKLNSAEFDDLVRRLINPETADPDDVVMATFDALDSTFKTSTVLAEQIQAAKKRGGAGGRVLEFLIPFPNTPTNIVRKALERVPGLGLAVGAGDRARIARHVERMKKSGFDVTEEAIENQLRRLKSKLYAKQITGSAAVYMGYALNKNGLLTTEYMSPIGAGEGEREEIARRGVTGEGPLSLRIGDTSYSLASLGTIAPLLALGAALSAAERSEDEVSLSDKLTTPISAVGRTVLEMPLLTGARDVIETLEGRGMARPAQVGRQLASFIPLSGGLSGIARALDVEAGARRPETFTEGFLSGMPGLSERAAPRVTALGERVGRVPQAELQAIFQPFTARSIATGPIYDVLEDIGYYPSAPRKLEGETEAEYSARREVEGLQERQVLQEVLAYVAKYPEFSKERLAADPQSREQLANIVRRTLSRVRSQNTRLRRAQELAP